ncbi:MAG: viral A-type inclusion protein [Leptotrichia sp.]|nr:viral A-type inclusion protein [Leptotrichia sp.]
MKKILFLCVLMLSINSFLYSYEDYYQKVYTVKISKAEIYKAVNATLQQQKQLSKVFDRYQKRAEGVNGMLKKYETKKEKLSEIESKRYEEIAKILSYDQFLLYNDYINSKKIEFEEKNDKIKNLLDNLELKNEQKADILKYDRDFKREVRKLKEKFMSEEDFSKEFERLRAERNEKIRSVLTEEQKKAVDNF